MVTGALVTTGYLTEDKCLLWVNSNQKHIQMAISSSSNVKFAAKLYLEGMKSQWVAETFFSWPLRIQLTYCRQFAIPLSVDDKDAYYKILIRDYGESNGDPEAFDESCKTDSQKAVIDRCVDNYDNENSVVKSILLERFLKKLSRLYDENTFLEALTALCDSPGQSMDFAGIVNILDRWDEVSQYPSGWAVNLAKL